MMELVVIILNTEKDRSFSCQRPQNVIVLGKMRHVRFGLCPLLIN
jgi:hypothetical protein